MSRRMFGTGPWKSIGGEVKERYQVEIKKSQSGEQTPDRTRNELTTEIYRYAALKGRTSALRLVELFPGTRQEDVACRMCETALDECTGSYEALSYVWGAADETTPIQVNGQTLEIGTNLRLALFNLREPDKPRTLWVDAICINQADTDERSQQVTIMDEIYRRAKRTVVWLRDEVEGETKAAMSMLETLADDAISHSQERSISLNEKGGEGHIVHLNNLPVSMLERHGVKDPLFDRYADDISAVHILESPWWHRAWTLQEILLASSATVIVGRYSIDWDRLCIGANRGLSLGIWFPIVMGIMPDAIIKPFLSLQLLKLRRRTQHPKESAAQVLLELLFQCRFRKASDSRDRIYSLLGLVASTRPDRLGEAGQLLPPLGIKPDYSLPANVIYVNVARQLILESSSFDVLGGCGASQPSSTQTPDSELALPSWVPHWNTAQAANPLLHDGLGRKRITHATSHSKAWPQFFDRTTLLLQAYELSTLTALAPPLAQPGVDTTEDPSKYDGVENIITTAAESGLSLRLVGMFLGRLWNGLAEVFEMLLAVVPLLATFATDISPTNPRPESVCRPKPSRYNTVSALVHNVSNLSTFPSPDEEPQDRLSVYWQTLSTGTYDDTAAAAPRRGPKIATQKLFYSWRASLKPIFQLHRWHAERKLRPLAFVGYVVKTWREYGEFARFLEGCFGRRLGRAANRYLCLVPATAEVGDKLMLARGGRVPLVLREEDGEPGYWRLVGEAYVQGIMHGEAWDEARCDEYKIR